MGTINFVLVGARNSGKTCYLSVLATHCPGISTANDETTEYLKGQLTLLDVGEVPQATASSLRELQFRYLRNSRKVDFSIDDYDGSFVESLSSRGNPDNESKNELKARIQECEGLIFFMPYETLHDDLALLDFENEINTIISLVEKITDGKYARLPFPACICVTKWDQNTHCQQKDDLPSALEYLESVPSYRRSLEKIRTLFDNMEVFPISSFGESKDGKPIPGKITPYQLEKPIDYCLNKLFPRYEQRIAEIQSDNNKAGLLEYLFELYDDLKHHKKGEYCRGYDKLEQELADRLLEEVRENNQDALNKEQARIYNSIRRDDLKDGIRRAVKKNKGAKRRKKCLTATATMLFVLVIGFGGFYFYQRSIEQRQFMHIQNQLDSANLTVLEVIPQVVAFNQQWGKIYLFSDDRRKIIIETGAKVKQSMHLLLDIVKKSDSPDHEVLNEIIKLSEALDLWPDNGLAAVLKAETEPLLNSFQLLKALRAAKGDSATMKPENYIKLKNRVDDSVYHWHEMASLMTEISNSIASRIKTTAEFAMKSNDIDELEKSADDLSMLCTLGNKEACHILNQDITPALAVANRHDKLTKMQNEIRGKINIAEITDVVRAYWLSDYTKQDKKDIHDLLQTKFEEIENKMIPRNRNLQTRDDLDSISDKIRKIKPMTARVIKAGDQNNPFSFRYKRPDDLQREFDDWDKKLKNYNYALNRGIRAYVAFQGDGSNDDSRDPLGFNCTWYDHNLIIDIGDGAKLSYDGEADYTCQSQNQTQTMKWEQQILLKTGYHVIKVKENDMMVDDPWSSGFRLEENHIFKFINDGEIDLNVDPYKLILSRK